jgi:hypothetical protein
MTDNSDLLQRLRGWLYERTDVAPEGYAFDKHTITFSLDRIPDYQNNPRWTETPLYGQDVIES